MQTPWGTADSVEHIADGIIFVTTPSHGGFRLDQSRNAQVPYVWRQASFNGQALRGWYEEDCDWSLVALTFPQHFEGHAEIARKTFDYYIAPKLGAK